MRAVVQRVSRASVTIDSRIAGEISKGAVIFVGIGREDDTHSATYLAGKIAHLRIFAGNPLNSESDVLEQVSSVRIGGERKMNLSLLDIGGSALVVSQFTLYADTRDGRRPSYAQAAPQEMANQLYEEFVRSLRSLGVRVETGVFKAHMQIELINDGPVTILVDSEKLI